MGYFGLFLLSAVVCQMPRLSAIKAVALERASLLLPFSVLDLSDTDQLIPVRQFDRIPLGVLELCYMCLCTLSSLSEASSTAQIHGDWCVIKASGRIGGVISLEAVLIVPLLSLFQNESSHLIIVSSSEDLVDGLL